MPTPLRRPATVHPRHHPTPHSRDTAPALASLAAALALAAALTPATAPAQQPGASTASRQVTESAYARAEQFLPWNAARLVTGDQVAPEFFDGDRFWFRSRTEAGHEFVVVNPSSATRRAAFDHARLAAALSVAADTAYEGGKLPFDTFEFVDGAGSARFGAIRFQVADSVQWTCDIGAYACTGPTSDAGPSAAETPSPDERWVAFARGENLWVRDAASGEEVQLTTDGETDHGYGAIPEGCCAEITSRRAGAERAPILEWSPDSRRIATHRYDEREVERFHLLEAADGRPVLHTWAYALPGDSVIPTAELWILDVEGRTSVRADVAPQPGFFTRPAYSDVKWTEDGSAVFYTTRSRDFKSRKLFRVDAATGEATELLEETGPTYVELNQFTSFAPAWTVIGDNGEEFLWWSERDGFGHLYLYGADGALRNQVTSGAWLVTQLIEVDEEERTVYFTAVGREEGRHPYFVHLYRVGLDGTGLELLSPEDAVHQITPTPSGLYFIDQHSTPETPPTAVVRDREGRIVQTVETADISRLEDAGWIPPVPFEAGGRDGVTKVHGLLWLPSDFDPEASYPVVDYIYPGPQIGAVTDYAFSAAGRGNGRALAELGFIVFAVDAFGTPLRSKAFHDAYYGNMGDNGIPDHISALKDLAGRHPQMDLGRVGIFGHSGGGFSSTDAILRWPDFFHVAVSGAGNHDNRGYHFPWAEKYQGLLVENADGTDNYDNQANQNLAANLKGRLLLHYGTLDDNVHPNMTIRLVEELIRHNKDFDMFVLPNRNHGYSNEPYVVRRTWDYFVEHLRGETPPREYRITGPGG